MQEANVKSEILKSQAFLALFFWICQETEPRGLQHVQQWLEVKRKKKIKEDFQEDFGFVSPFLFLWAPDFFFIILSNEAISTYFIDSAKTERKVVFHAIPRCICDLLHVPHEISEQLLTLIKPSP